MAGTGRKLSLYPSAQSGVYNKEISLRDELYKIFRGDGPESGKAHWVILRHFDKTTFSQYWNPQTREAVGGPPWVYTDKAVLTYSALRPAIGFGIDTLSEMSLVPGRFDDFSAIFYFEHDVSVDTFDMIYELDWEKPQKPLDLESVTKTRRYQIKFLWDYRSDNQGRIEYKATVCRVDEVSWG